MWIALKPFRYRGVSYLASDQVPAEKWSSRRALVSMRKIRFVPDVEVVIPMSTIRNMKRVDLNEYASTHGIPDAETYPNRDALLERIEETRRPESEDEDDTAPPEDTESKDGESEEQTASEDEEEAPSEDEEDNLFAEDEDTEDTPSE